MATQTPNNRPRPARFNFMWIWAVILVGIVAASFLWDDKGAPVASDLTTVKDMIQKGDVERVNVTGNRETIEVFLKEDAIKRYREGADERYKHIPAEGNQLYFTHGSIEILNEEINLAEEAYREHLLAQDSTLTVAPYDVTVTYDETEGGWGSFFLNIFPWIFLIAIWFFFFRGMSRGGGGAGGIMNVGKARAQVFDKDQKKKVTFKDVAGLEEAKVEIMEIVDFLKKADKYRKLGAKIPKGALLVGPPGTGKTLLAKAVAGEANVPFLSISGSDFVEMFVGVGASRVRDLFKQAKEKSPSIIFIDEIDAIGRARSKSPMSGGNDERESTLNQLLTEMDGFGTNSGVIVIAATNRADILDKALMRAGRFDRQIYVELPDLIGRKEIFEVHMRKLKLADDVNVEFLAKQTPGFSGADIANVCNEAALMAARRNKESIEKQDFLDAIDRIVGGLEKKNKVITDSEKKVIAFHEAGHATTSWLLEFAHPLVKVTIVPRGKALGAAWYLPNERQITTKEQMYHEMIATLGGRAAEQLIFGHISTGALSDLEKVTKQATAMVAYYGLDERIGNRSYYDSTGQQDYSLTKPFSDKTAEIIDEQVSKLIESAYQEALRILGDNLDGLTQLANKLIDKEVVFGDDLEMIFGKRPWVKEEIDFPKESQQTTDKGQESETDNVSEEDTKNINTEESQN